MQFKFLFVVLIVFIVSMQYGLAQPYIGSKQLLDSNENNLFLRFEATSFLKDNEYNNHFTKGGMNIGFFVKPTLEYYITPRTRLNLGVHVLKYSGREEFTQVIPIFTVQQRLVKGLDLVMGSFYGTNSHNLEEPIFNMDNYYKNNIEYGGQLLYHSKYFDGDAWLNWETHIMKDDPFQEQFQMGISTNLKFQFNKFKIQIPLQLFTIHKGGQIDSNPAPARSYFNGVSGLRFIYAFNKNNAISFEPLVLRYKALRMPDTGQYAYPYREGEAYYLKLKYSNKYIRLMVGYWHARAFVAPKGEFLFQSVSNYDPNYTQKYRKMIPFKVIINYPVSKFVNIQIRTDNYYDIMTTRIDHTYSLYITINDAFFLTKVKRKTENR